MYRNKPVDHPRDRVYQERSLSLRDILPVKPKHYDKNRAPKLMGQPTIVYFHVTVLSIDSINEESMASYRFNCVIIIIKKCLGAFAILIHRMGYYCVDGEYLSFRMK